MNSIWIKIVAKAIHDFNSREEKKRKEKIDSKTSYQYVFHHHAAVLSMFLLVTFQLISKGSR
jgi:hypothetical protein